MENKIISTPTHIQFTMTRDEAARLQALIKLGLKARSLMSTPDSFAFECAIEEYDKACDRG